MTIATTALTGAPIVGLVVFCAAVLIFVNVGESFFERFRGGAFYTAWCIIAAGIGIIAVAMLLHR